MTGKTNTAAVQDDADYLPPRMQRLSAALAAELPGEIERQTKLNACRLKGRDPAELARLVAILTASRMAPPALDEFSRLTECSLVDALRLIRCRIAMVQEALPMAEHEEQLTEEAAEGIVLALREAEEALQAVAMWQQITWEAFRQAVGVKP